MEITNSITVLDARDIALPEIAEFFKPMDPHAVELLRNGAPEDYMGKITMFPLNEGAKVIIAICIVPKGKTPREISIEISAEGWHYGGLADWYRHLLESDALKGKNISLLGEISRDEDFKDWYSCVYCRSRTDADLSMKPLWLNRPFLNEKKILIVKTEKEKKLK